LGGIEPRGHERDVNAPGDLTFRRGLDPAEARDRQDQPENRDRDAANSSHLITSSARCRSGGGMMRPIAFAVLRLITKWYFWDCSMGRSVGRAPRKIRS